MKTYFVSGRMARAGVLSLAWWLAAGCQQDGARISSGGSAVVQFHADSNVRNPAMNDAYPGVRRVVVRAVDDLTRPDAVVQVSDRVGVPAGSRTLLLAAEAAGGRVTLSELSFVAEPGTDYFIRPAPEPGGRILAELRRGAHGEVVARSRPWSPPAKDGADAASRAR